MGRSIAITSGKGGAGKSTLTAALSEGLSRLGHRVAAVDGDMGLRNLDIMFGLQDDIIYDLGDVLTGRCPLDKAMIEALGGVMYLAASNRRLDRVQADALPLVVNALKKHFDYVLLDCPAGIGPHVFSIALAADEAMVVTTPDYTAVRDAAKTAVLLRRRGVKELRLVINKYVARVANQHRTPNLDEMIDAIQVQLIGVIPKDDEIPLLQNMARSVLETRTRDVPRHIKDICQRLEGIPTPLGRLR